MVEKNEAELQVLDRTIVNEKKKKVTKQYSEHVGFLWYVQYPFTSF